MYIHTEGMENPMTSTTLKLSWDAYTSKHFDRIYNQHADELGHYPSFTVLHGGDHARVITTEPDAARAIINDLEAAIRA